MNKNMTKKEIDIQLAIGSMDKADAFVELVIQKLKPIPWPTNKQLRHTIATMYYPVTN